jgi:copper chaperone CopZ
MKALLLLILLLPLQVFAQKIVVDVPGMVCQMCVQGMKKNFKTAVVNADKDVIVDLDKKTVTVNLKKKISEDEIKERVKDAGYNAKKITWVKVAETKTAKKAPASKADKK